MAEETPNNAAGDWGTIDFECTALEWLRVRWPAALTWFGLAIGAAIAIAALSTRSYWWALLFLPWWLIGGRAFGILKMLINGGEKITLLLPPLGANHCVLGVSSYGSDSVTPLGAPDVYDYERAWLVCSIDGRYQVVVPKAQLSEQKRTLFEERCGRKLR